ncbi:Peptidase M16 inactive domain protein, partial [Operophtera brumata]
EECEVPLFPGSDLPELSHVVIGLESEYHWMFNATAYNHAYGDTGLFCVHSAAPPNRIYDTTL